MHLYAYVIYLCCTQIYTLHAHTHTYIYLECEYILCHVWGCIGFHRMGEIKVYLTCSLLFNGYFPSYTVME